MSILPVILCKLFMIMLLIAMASGCGGNVSRKEDQQKTAATSQASQSAGVKLQLHSGMSESHALAQMKEHGYATAPVQDYPSADGGGISVYVPRDVVKRHYMLIVEWAGPLQRRSVRRHAEREVRKQDESIPLQELRELLYDN